MAAVGWLLAGLAALIVGAELVVRYGALLARRLHVPQMIIGLTIVSIGTSAPELAVGIDAMRVNAGSLAVGNIAGTNIVNLLLILGLSAAIRTIDFDPRTLRLDLPAMAAVAVMLFLLSLDGQLQFWEGIPLVLAAIGYSGLLVWWTRREARVVPPEVAALPREPVPRSGPLAAVGQVTLLVLGIAIIVVGADWLVDGAVELARISGVSDAFIGLTVVAIGTSAPELVTALVSTIRGNRDIAIGNLIGSSVYNLTLILGVPVLVAKGSGPIEDSLLHIDLPAMVAVCLLCIPIFLTGRRLSRLEGVSFVVAYLVYLGYLIVLRT